MILQELLRNIVLYRSLINPLLQLVKENMFTLWKLPYAPQESDLKLIKRQTWVEAKKNGEHISQVSDLSLFNISKTNTIPMQIYQCVNYKSRIVKEKEQYTATISRFDMFVLGNDRDSEWPMESTKTILSINVLCLNFLSLASGVLSGTTTGLTFEKCILYFSHETHEKREYLGEFSLTHEEIQFNSMKERG